MHPRRSRSPSHASLAGRGPDRPRMSAITDGAPGGACTMITTAARRSAGRSGTRRVNAPIPPADAPMTMRRFAEPGCLLLPIRIHAMQQVRRLEVERFQRYTLAPDSTPRHVRCWRVSPSPVRGPLSPAPPPGCEHARRVGESAPPREHRRASPSTSRLLRHVARQVRRVVHEEDADVLLSLPELSGKARSVLSRWPQEELRRITESDDLHVAPFPE
jgi:hypothetical protein